MTPKKTSVALALLLFVARGYGQFPLTKEQLIAYTAQNPFDRFRMAGRKCRTSFWRK
jgi:hypothetical protein